MTKNKYILFKNAISLLVAFTTNLPELIVPNNVKWTYVADEILFTYISILILFIINEKIFRPNSPATNLSKIKILASFVVAWICNDILGQCFVFLNKYYGLPVLESTMHVYTHPIRDFIISSIVVTTGYLINQNLKSQKIMVENQQLKTENLKNQYETLKNQLNPHMLFNSLNTLYALVRENPDKAQDYISQLSKVMRYTLKQDSDIERSTISLQEELNFINSYIYLLKMRFEDNISFVFDIDNSLLMKKIPRMAIQLLVENAVKHNEISNRNPLHITIRTIDDETLEVANNLQPRRGATTSTGIGLNNLRKRYRLLFNKDIEIQEKENNIFSVKIPLT
ncbi:sensor histidine kinase [Prevotella sp.]|uniref:sensor histidine kinase n=1 Tax=Prevotella sp. TaxID=59823 RepID=UPI003AB349A2